MAQTLKLAIMAPGYGRGVQESLIGFLPSVNSQVNYPTFGGLNSIFSGPVGGTPVQMPDLVIGDTLNILIALADPNGSIYGYAGISGDPTYTVEMGIGAINAPPNGGTFALSYGGHTTTAIAYNADAVTVQDALVALASIGAGQVSVTGAFPSWTVEFPGTHGLQAVTLMTGSGALLLPQGSTYISNERIGSGSQNAIQRVSLQDSPGAFQSVWTGTQNIVGGVNLTGAWAAAITLNTEGVYDLLNGATSASVFTEIRLIDAGGNVMTVAQLPTTLRGEVINPRALVPTLRGIVFDHRSGCRQVHRQSNQQSPHCRVGLVALTESLPPACFRLG